IKGRKGGRSEFTATALSPFNRAFERKWKWSVQAVQKKRAKRAGHCHITFINNINYEQTNSRNAKKGISPLP
ncbi:hypothetical protein, partial [uncultured Bacteroides sp.]|uniref:hypothetical protein n=1 Tax=uncultured Bacteroides sp. TaxID=162156 RepID=UPI0027DBE04B